MVSKKVESAYPYIGAIILSVISLVLSFRVRAYSEFLAGSITIAAIFLGFLGTLAGILLSVEHRVVSFLKRIGKFRVMVDYLWRAINIAFLFVLLSFMLQLMPKEIAPLLDQGASALWCFLGALVILTTYRAIKIVTLVLTIMADHQE